jgi:amidase
MEAPMSEDGKQHNPPPSRFPAIVAMDALTLGQRVRARDISCLEVMTTYLDHIESINPAVNAIVSLRERSELLAASRHRDEQLARGEIMGPLHGFPQAIKDLAATEGIRTTHGSPIFKDVIPTADAIFVERMRNAGAIIIGKTNVPEFGLGSQTYNPVFGPTRNAYDPALTAGGSSGGAAVALALRMQAVADGSDHAGSLRNPSAFNNVFGFRTSFGRVPQESDEVFLPSFAVTGPMARNVADLQMLLAVQSGYDPRVPLSVPGDGTDVMGSLASDVRGLRIGWLGDFGGHLPMEAGVLDLCREALRVFELLGCSIEEITPDFDPEAIWQAWMKLRSWQNASRLGPLHADPAKRVLLKPEAQWEIEAGLSLSASEIITASRIRSSWYQTVRQLFKHYDYLMLPSAQVFPFAIDTPWPRQIAGRTMDTYHRWMEVVIPVTMSGCPALGMPVGFDPHGRPMGMQIVAPNHSELAIMRLAYAYEQATQWVDKRPPPGWS